MKPSISVVIPVYNRFDLLKHSVESVLSQTLPVSEVILVDDGSFDGTSHLLPAYIDENSTWRERVRYFRQENQGPNVARNLGIELARGEWLAFNDNDDIWLPHKLAWQFRALEQFKNECSACITDAWFMNNPYMKMTLFQLSGKEHRESIGLISDPLEYMLNIKSVTGTHPVWLQNLVVRTELARRAGGFDPALRFGDDDDFAFRVGCETKLAFVNIPMVLIDRTIREDRHVGASKNWDDADFRLRMAQHRMEKRLGMSERLPRTVQKLVRRDLAAVYSGWANWFLQKNQNEKARAAVTRAARLYPSPNLAVKWALTRFAPELARKAAGAREDNRNRKAFGLG
jgi:glycosyltransferase involved in cell wall biosynthesis